MSVGTKSPNLGNLNAMEVIGSQADKAKWQHPTSRGQLGVVTVMDSRVKAPIRMV